MQSKNSRIQWWQTDRGIIASQESVSLDTPTEALVRDFLEMSSDERLQQEPPAQTEESYRMVEKPIPFKPVRDWMAWMGKGSDIDH